MDLIVVGCTNQAVGPDISDISDNKGNTWNIGTLSGVVGSAIRPVLYWCQPTTVGTGHTVTIAPALSGRLTGLAVKTFAATTSTTGSPLDQEAHENGFGPSTTRQTNSVTPTENDSLLVTSLGSGDAEGTVSINSSFTAIVAKPFDSGVSFGVHLAHKIQTTAGAENPTWTCTIACHTAGVIATFFHRTAGIVEAAIVETLAATTIRSSSATIRGRIDPNGVAMDGRFRWWICGESPPSYTETTPVSVGNGSSFVTYSVGLTGLSPGTTYCFQAIGNDGTDDIYGVVRSFTTTGEAVFVDGTVSHPLTWVEFYF
jgi:hypothetical protein